MEKDLTIRSAYLATKENPSQKVLACGKIISDYQSGNYLFYLFEIDVDPVSGLKIKNAILDCLKKKKEIYNQTHLEQILEDINNSLEQIAKSGNRNWIGNINAILGVIEDNQLSIANSGNITGYLFRKGKISTLTEKTTANTLPQKTFIDLTSGSLTETDKVIFGNNRLYDYFALEKIRRMYENQDAKSLAHDLWKELKHKKVVDINAIILETEEVVEDSIEKTLLPEFFFIDEKAESVMQRIQKKVRPRFKELKNQIQSILLVVTDLSKNIAKKIKENWKEKVKPNAKNIIKESSSSFNKAKEKISPTVKGISSPKKLQGVKLKTNLYSKGTEYKLHHMFRSISDTLFSFSRVAIKKENRKYLYIVLMICFLSIGYFKIQANNKIRDQRLETEKLANLYPQAEEAFDKAKENIALGKTKGTDELQNALSIAQDSARYPGNKEKSDKLIFEITKSLDSFSKTTRFYDAEPIISINSKIQKAVLAGSDIYTVNQDGKIYSANINGGNASLVGSIGKDQGEVIDIAYSENDNKIYMLSSKQKIIAFQINTKTNEIVSNGDTKDWIGASSIATFGGNLYVLNNTTGQIFKHTQSDMGFSKGSIYGNSKNIDLKNSKGLSIDGNIYVLLSNGDSAKFIRSVYDPDFKLKNLPEPNSTVKNPMKIVTDEDNNFLFIFDREANRIIKFDKSGEFVNQYAFNSMTINDFIVNNKIQKLWIISDDKVFQFDL